MIFLTEVFFIFQSCQAGDEDKKAKKEKSIYCFQSVDILCKTPTYEQVFL